MDTYNIANYKPYLRKREVHIMSRENSEVFFINEEFAELMARWIGTTVTIYTTSGGASGCGFTGILAAVDPCVVKLITCLGPAPCCSLGSACVTPGCPTFEDRRFGSQGVLNNVGATVDIPIENIAAFIHNTLSRH